MFIVSKDFEDRMLSVGWKLILLCYYMKNPFWGHQEDMALGLPKGS